MCVKREQERGSGTDGETDRQTGRERDRQSLCKCRYTYVTECEPCVRAGVSLCVVCMSARACCKVSVCLYTHVYMSVCMFLRLCVCVCVRARGGWVAG